MHRAYKNPARTVTLEEAIVKEPQWIKLWLIILTTVSTLTAVATPNKNKADVAEKENYE